MSTPAQAAQGAASAGSEKMSTGRVVSYALGDVANNLSFMMTSMFLMVYMTDIAGLSAGIAGTIYGITKIWAGISDLIAGNTVDRANTRWGRLRPWLVGVSPLLAIALVALFSTPAGLSPTTAVVWILLFDAAFQLFYSFVNIPYGSLSAAMTQNPVDRSRLAGARSIASAVTGVALALVLSPQFKDTSADGVRLKFTITTIVLALVAIALYWICFLNAREVVPRSPGKVKLANTLAMVRKNRPLLMLCLGALFLLGAMFTMMAVQMYFAKLVLGSASLFIYLQLASTLGTVISASFVPAITVRLGKKQGYAAFAVIVTLGLVLVGLTPHGRGGLWMALLAWFLYGIGTGGSNALMFSMQADTVDYGEWVSGTRAEGGAYSILSFVRKCGQGLGGFFGGFIMAGFGYVAGAQVQTDRALTGIQVAAGWVPAALTLVAAVVILFLYPLTAEKHAEIVQELAGRRALRASDTVVAADATSGLVAERPVVTLNEQYGAGASQIGEVVAQQLGVQFVGNRFSSEDLEAAELAADRLAEMDTASARFLASFAATGADVDRTLAANAEADHDMVLENTRALAQYAREGAVIVGRDATAVLRGVPGVLRVGVEAPVESRVKRAAITHHVSEQVAAERLEREDRMRTDMSRRLMAWEPGDHENYDLVVDTSRTDVASAAREIVEAYRARQR